MKHHDDITLKGSNDDKLQYARLGWVVLGVYEIIQSYEARLNSGSVIEDTKLHSHPILDLEKPPTSPWLPLTAIPIRLVQQLDILV